MSWSAVVAAFQLFVNTVAIEARLVSLTVIFVLTYSLKGGGNL